MGAFLILTMTGEGGGHATTFVEVGEGEKMSSMRKSCPIKNAIMPLLRNTFFDLGQSGDVYIYAIHIQKV